MLGVFRGVNNAAERIIGMFRPEPWQAVEPVVDTSDESSLKVGQVAVRIGEINNYGLSVILTCYDLSHALINAFDGKDEYTRSQFFIGLKRNLENSGRVFGRVNLSRAVNEISSLLAANPETMRIVGQRLQSEGDEKASSILLKADRSAKSAKWFATKDGKDFLRESILRHKSLFIDVVEAAYHGQQVELSDVIGLSGFVKGEPAEARKRVDIIFGYKSINALAHKATMAAEVTSPEEFIEKAAKITRPIGKIRPELRGGLFGALESMRDLYSSYLYDLSRASPSLEQIKKASEVGKSFTKAGLDMIYAVMVQNEIHNPLRRDLESKGITYDKAKLEDTKRFVTAKAAEIALPMCERMIRAEPALAEAQDFRDFSTALEKMENTAPLIKLLTIINQLNVQPKVITAAIFNKISASRTNTLPAKESAIKRDAPQLNDNVNDNATDSADIPLQEVNLGAMASQKSPDMAVA